MRRVFLFAAFLLLLGLTTAFAASFGVEAEDIASFTTPVSISVPSEQPRTLYVKNQPNHRQRDEPAVPGVLDPTPPPNSPVTQKTLLRDPQLIEQSQSDVAKYHAWETAGSDPAFTISGTATLYIDSNGGTNQITVGLFECWEPPDPDDLATMTIDADVPAGHGCALISATTSTGGSAASGYSERTAVLAVPSTLVEAGHRLRLKVVNRSSADWSLQWGFNAARSSQLQTTITWS
jgi:hypothetical protein